VHPQYHLHRLGLADDAVFIGGVDISLLGQGRGQHAADLFVGGVGVARIRQGDFAGHEDKVHRPVQRLEHRCLRIHFRLFDLRTKLDAIGIPVIRRRDGHGRKSTDLVRVGGREHGKSNNN
jgi:hypothetical protein